MSSQEEEKLLGDHGGQDESAEEDESERKTEKVTERVEETTESKEVDEATKAGGDFNVSKSSGASQEGGASTSTGIGTSVPPPPTMKSPSPPFSPPSSPFSMTPSPPFVAVTESNTVSRALQAKMDEVTNNLDSSPPQTQSSRTPGIVSMVPTSPNEGSVTPLSKGQPTGNTQDIIQDAAEEEKEQVHVQTSHEQTSDATHTNLIVTSRTGGAVVLQPPTMTPVAPFTPVNEEMTLTPALQTKLGLDATEGTHSEENDTKNQDTITNNPSSPDTGSSTNNNNNNNNNEGTQPSPSSQQSPPSTEPEHGHHTLLDPSSGPEKDISLPTAVAVSPEDDDEDEQNHLHQYDTNGGEQTNLNQQERHQEVFIESATEYDPIAERRKLSRREKRRVISVVILVALVIGPIAVGLAVHFLRRRPPPLPPAPVCERDARGYFDMLETVSENTTLCDAKTPQYAAYQWIMQNDTLGITPNDNSFVQRYVLALFYFSTRGENWTECGSFLEDGVLPCSHLCFSTYCEQEFCDVEQQSCNRSAFLSPVDECEWAGVVCFNGNVREIYLGVNNLDGTIPSEISELVFLRIFQLPVNNLHGSIPSSIGKLNNLNQLALRFNGLTGSVPDELFRLETLSDFDMGSNFLTGTISPKWGNMSNLVALRIWNNSFTGSIPDTITQLDKMTLFQILMNALTGTIPEDFGRLTSLQYALMNGNLLTGTIPPSVGNLTDLVNLQVHNNKMTGTIPDAFFDLRPTQLVFLENQFTGTISSRFGEMVSLTALYLRNNLFHGTIPTELGQLTNMHSLWLDGNDLNGSMPEDICALRTRNDSALETLAADCDGSGTIECDEDCCSVCCDPITLQCIRFQR